MDFEDLICMSSNEVEYGIRCITERFGVDIIHDDNERFESEIREDLTSEFNGCYPYFESEDEAAEQRWYFDSDGEAPCYLSKCSYGCEYCPMKNCEADYEFNPKSDKIEDMVIALIKAVKANQNYTPTENEISKAIEIIFD